MLGSRGKNDGDVYDLDRFVRAQEPVIDRVFFELDAGDKQTQWMWFVCPQIRGLSCSEMADYYALGSLDEARAYLKHLVLGRRLHTVMEAMLGATEAICGRPKRTIEQVLGEADAAKLRSCATLFKRVEGDRSVFALVLDRLFGGEDPETSRLLEA